MATVPNIATPQRLLLLSSVVMLALIQALSLIGLAWITQRLIDDVLNGAAIFQPSLLLGVTALVLLSAVCRWFERIVAEWLGNNYVHEIRMKLFDVLALRATTGSSNSVPDRQQGVHMMRFSNDLSALRQWVSMGLSRLISASLFLIGVVIALATLAPSVAGGVGLAVTLCLVAIAAMSIGLERSVRETRNRRGQLSNTVSDLVSSVSQLAAYGRTPRERKRLLRKSRALGNALEKRAFWVGGLRGLTDFSHRVVMFVALVAGSIGLQNQQLSISALLAILGVTALVGAPLRDLGRVFEYWKNYRVAREKIAVGFNVEDKHAKATRRLPDAEGRLTIRGLRFASLLTINRLTVPAGQRIAVVGSNGTGKSTLLRLIAGLVNPDSGHVRLDRVDTSRLSHTDRRSAIGIASQQLPLMPGSISKNIRYRKPRATTDEFDIACTEAGLDQKVVSFAKGFKTRLGASGSGMSEGETARVKLARALLGKPRLLLFDEIESGLDQEGRNQLHALFSNYPGTIIYATHDEELVQRADRVWRLNRGRVQSKKMIETTLEQKSHERSY